MGGWGRFIVFLQVEMPESYVEAFLSIDNLDKSIIACVAGKEFANPDMIKMVKAGIPVLSTPEPGGGCSRHHVPAPDAGKGARSQSVG